MARLISARALATGVLDALAEAPSTTTELATRTGATDEDLPEAFLRMAAVGGLLDSDSDSDSDGDGDGDGDGVRWRPARAGRAVVADDLVRASYEAFGGFHADLYRQLHPVLAGRMRRRDLAEQGQVIARMSAGFDAFVHDLLVRTVRARHPRRVLDVGCGAGLEPAGLLEAEPGATGVGVDVDGGAAALAERTLRERGLAARATCCCVLRRRATCNCPTPVR